MFQLAKTHPRYQKYNPTNIDWIGDIPDGWEARKLKFGIVRNDGGVWGEDPIDDISGTVVLRSTEQKVDGTLFIENPARRMLDNTEIEKSILKEGDLLITKSSGSSNHIGKTSLIDTKTAELNCCFSNFMQRLRMKKDISSKYIAYALNNPKIGREQLDYLSQSTTGLANLNGTLLGEIIFPSPSFEEQKKIATYLDEKTALLDEAIAKKKQQIKFLSEHRTALINNAITKGLDPNTEMKESGMEWIGMIPKGWKVRRIKYVSDINLSSLPENTNPDYALKYIDISNVGVSGIISAPEEMYFQNAPSRARRIVRQNDTIISTVRTYLKALAFLDISADNLIVSTGFAVLTPKEEKICPKYLYFSVLAEYFISKVEAQSTGVSYPAINASEIGAMLIVLPTIEEQKRIIEHLEKEITYIEAMKEKIEQSIELLQEYKTSLISHAVSGKIKVS